MNYVDRCTITAPTVTSIDPDTGRPVQSVGTVMHGQACSFTVLSAEQHAQAWGDGADETNTSGVTASLTIPSWAPALDGALPDYRVSVSGFPALTWRIASVRPGAQWSTYQLSTS